MANNKDKSGTMRRFDDVYRQFYDNEKEFDDVDFALLDANPEQQQGMQVEHHNDDDDDNDDDNDDGDKNKADPTVEEQRLSQKLSQLSASGEQDDQSKQVTTIKKRPPLEPTTVTKKMKTDKEGSAIEMPKYLSARNKAFEHMIHPLLEKSASSMNITDLRQIALLIHKIAVINLYQSLWTACLRSGTGTIRQDEQQQQPNASTTLSIWPEEVKAKMITKGITTTTDENENNNDACLNFVDTTLRQFRDRSTHYQTQLYEKKRHLTNFKREMEEAIVQFVDHEGLSSTRLQIESKIAVVEYTYKDRVIELAFRQLNPNPHQLHLFENLTRAKQEKEKTKYEVAILKQRAVCNYLPEPFNTSQIPPPPSLETISNLQSRERLSERYAKNLQQSKSDMMAVYIASAEAHMRECEVKFDTDLAQFKQDQRSSSTERQLSQAMITVLKRHFKNLSERLQGLYELKMRFIGKTSH